MFTTLSVLRIKAYRHLWLAQMCSQIAAHMLAFVLLIKVYELTKSNTAVSLLVLTLGIPALLLGIVAGVLVDHWPKVKVLFWCNVLRGFIVLLMLLSTGNLIGIYLISTLIALITQFFIPAEVPLIPQIVSKDKLMAANGIFTFTYYLTMSAGFISSGPVLSLFGERLTFLLVSLLFFAAGYFVYLIPSTRKKRYIPWTKVMPQIFSHLHQAWSFVKKRKVVAESIFLFTATQAVVFALSSLTPGYADKVLSIQLTKATVVVMGPAVAGIILSALLIGEISSSRIKHRLIDIGIIGSGVVLLALSALVKLSHNLQLISSLINMFPITAFLDRLNISIVLFFLLGVFNAAVVVPVNTFLQEATNDSIRSRIYGFLAAASGGISILPVIGVGQMADRIGVGKTIFTMAILITAFGVYRTISNLNIAESNR